MTEANISRANAFIEGAEVLRRRVRENKQLEALAPLLDEIGSYDQVLAEKRMAIASLQTDVDKLTAEQRKLVEKNTDLKDYQRKARDEADDIVRAAKADAAKLEADAKAEVQKLNERADEVDKQVKHLENEAAKAESRLKEFDQRIEKARTGLLDIKAELEALRNEAREAEKRKDAAEDRLKEIGSLIGGKA